MGSWEEAIELMKNSPQGESWIEVKGKIYETDMGYALEGISILEDIHRRMEESQEWEW